MQLADDAGLRQDTERISGVFGVGEGLGYWLFSSQCKSGHQMEWLYQMNASLGSAGCLSSQGYTSTWGPWKSLHSIAPSPHTPSGTYLLILVIARLRVGLCGGGRWWGVGCWGVATVAPIVVGRWRWRWRWWGCIGLAVTSLVVGWLAVTRLESGGKNQGSVK